MSRVKRSLNLKDFYKAYVIRCKDKQTNPKPYSEFKKVLLSMGEAMSDILLQEGIVALPWNIGDVFFKQSDRNDPVIDGKKTREQGKLAYEFNDHTDGIVYSLFWLSPERVHKKRKLWCFSGFRGVKRKSGQLLKNKQVTYPDFKQMNPRAIKR